MFAVCLWKAVEVWPLLSLLVAEKDLLLLHCLQEAGCCSEPLQHTVKDVKVIYTEQAMNLQTKRSVDVSPE